MIKYILCYLVIGIITIPIKQMIISTYERKSIQISIILLWPILWITFIVYLICEGIILGADFLADVVV